MMIITLEATLKQLKAIEKAKPVDQRRHVPTQEELASVAGVTQPTMSRLINRDKETLHLQQADSILNHLHKLGFNVSTESVVKWQPSNNQ